MASRQNVADQRFDQAERPRPFLLAFIAACHVLAILLLPRLFVPDYAAPVIDPSQTAWEPAGAQNAAVEEQAVPQYAVDDERLDQNGSPIRREADQTRSAKAPGNMARDEPQSRQRLAASDTASGDDPLQERERDRRRAIDAVPAKASDGSRAVPEARKGTASGISAGPVPPDAFNAPLNVDWAPQWDPRSVLQYLPSEAMRHRIRGWVLLECTALRGDHVNACEIIEEHPGGYGFGQAALDAEQLYLLHVTDASDNRLYDVRIRFYIDFRVR